MVGDDRRSRPTAAVMLLLPLQVIGELCDSGHFCLPPKICCNGQCCLVDPGGDTQPYGFYHLSFWNMWYFWFIVIFLIISCFGGCGYWRRRHVYLSSHSSRSRRSRRGSFDDDSPSTDGRDTPYPSLQYSPHGSFPAPPPYSEVAAKPDMYPLVQGGNDYKDDGSAYSFNTPYIHSFVPYGSGRSRATCRAYWSAAPPQVHTLPTGTLCPSSPAESNCSSLPFSTNQANSIFPPPYSEGACAASNVSTPGSLLSAYTPTDVSSLHLGPGSPPVATTPTSQNMFSELPTPSDTGASDRGSLSYPVTTPVDTRPVTSGDGSVATDNSASADHERILSALVANIQNMTSRAESSLSGGDISISASYPIGGQGPPTPSTPGYESSSAQALSLAGDQAARYSERSSAIDISSIMSGDMSAVSEHSMGSFQSRHQPSYRMDSANLPALVLDCSSQPDWHPRSRGALSSAATSPLEADLGCLHRSSSAGASSVQMSVSSSLNILHSPQEPEDPFFHHCHSETSDDDRRVACTGISVTGGPGMFPRRRPSHLPTSSSVVHSGRRSTDPSPKTPSDKATVPARQHVSRAPLPNRYSTDDDTANLVECAVETDGFGDS